MEPDREHPGGPASAARLGRMVVDAIDPAGSVGRDRLLYVVVAALVLVLGALLAARTRRRAILGVGLAAAALVLLPLAVHPLHDWASRAEQKLFLELGSRRLAYLGADRLSTPPSPFTSWYGPLGLLLFLVALPIVLKAVRQKALPRVAFVLTLSPVSWSYSRSYLLQRVRGRYVMSRRPLLLESGGPRLASSPGQRRLWEPEPGLRSLRQEASGASRCWAAVAPFVWGPGT